LCISKYPDHFIKFSYQLLIENLHEQHVTYVNNNDERKVSDVRRKDDRYSNGATYEYLPGYPALPLSPGNPGNAGGQTPQS
jgi:hypothetical protein